MSENLAMCGFAFGLIWAIYLAQTASSRTHKLEERIQYLTDKISLYEKTSWEAILKSRGKIK